MVLQTIILVSIAINTILLAIIALFSYSLWKKEKKLEKREAKLHGKSERIIEHAQYKGEQTIQHSVEKAQGILDSTQIFKQAIENKFEGVLEKTLQTYVETLQNVALEKTKEFSQNMTTFTQNELKQMQAVVEKQRMEETAKVTQEVKAFKQAQLAHVEVKINNLIGAWSKQLFGKTISAADHKKLIMHALEEAQKQHII